MSEDERRRRSEEEEEGMEEEDFHDSIQDEEDEDDDNYETVSEDEDEEDQRDDSSSSDDDETEEEDKDKKEEDSSSNSYGCQHYKRRCRFFTPCCEKIYPCRFCHDSSEPSHALKRSDVAEIVCSECDTRQGISNVCVQCGVTFGRYYCGLCKLYDDTDKKQFHCDGCGICRVGGRDNFFHCPKCDMCLPIHLKETHGGKCIENISRRDCPVCLEDIHTSIIPSHVPPCNHLMHNDCFKKMLKSGHNCCPICGTSLTNMSGIWKLIDTEIAETPLPSSYRNLFAKVYCRDCHKNCTTEFHFLGNKCTGCKSYNTVRDNGPLLKKENETFVEAVIEEDDQEVD